MKRTTIILLFTLLLQPSVWSIERNLLVKSIDKKELRQILVTNQKWVPYPAYKNRTGWDKLIGNNKEKLIQRGEKKLKYEWKVIKATDYLAYERTGNRQVMQNPNSKNTRALTDLVLAELAEGKGRFLDAIINGVFYQCERTSWVLSAHLPLQLSKRTLPDHTDQVIGLASADIGSLLAWTYYFFHQEFDKVNPIISKRLHAELYNKIILPYRNENRFWWMGFKPRPDGLVNNWNPWINTNVLQCIALLENDKEKYANDVYKTMRSVDKFINYVKSDGACEEGPSYWAHAAGKLYDYLEVLSWITDNKISLFENKMIQNMGEYIVRSYVGNNWVVNFADASARFSSDAPLIFRYGKAIKNKDMQHFASYLVNKKKKSGLSLKSNISDLLRKLESLKYYSELVKTPTQFITDEVTNYPQTQFYYFKNKNNLFLAVKGGYNAESHNHNDAGTFSLWADKMPIFIDAGVGTYTKKTFSKDRYTIWTMRSNYHNLPTINGQEQQFGKKYKATNIQLNKKKKILSLNIAKAYSSKANIISWKRKYQLKKNKLIIKDNYKLKKAIAPNKIHFMLWGKVKLHNGKVKINVKKRKLELLYNKNQFNATLDTIVQTDIRLSKVWGKEIYRLTLTAKSKKREGNYKYIIQKTEDRK